MSYKNKSLAFILLFAYLVVKGTPACAELSFDLLTTLGNDRSTFTELAETPQNYIEEVMNSSLLGGVTILIDNEILIDASVKRQMEDLFIKKPPSMG